MEAGFMAKIATDLTEGPVLPKLVRFALPFLASNIIQSLYNVADMLIVGNFCGTASMSGVVIGGQITQILTNLVIGLSMGATVLIGQYQGAGNTQGLKRVTATIITLLALLGVGISVLMLIFKEGVLDLIKTPIESYGEANRYLTVTVAGIIFIFGYNALSSILRGMGNSRQPFFFVMAACIANIVLDLVFVALLRLEAFGAALATVISQAMSMIFCIIYMVRNDFHFDFKLRSFHIYGDQAARIFKIGLPQSIQNGITSISFLVNTSIVNTVGGVTASAAVGAAGRFNSFVFMPAQAMSASISAMSAQNIGAGKMDRAVKACRMGTIFAVTITYIFFVFVQIFPDRIISLFGSDPQMIEAGVTYLRTFSLDFLLIPLIFTINGFLNGGGHTLFSLINGLLSAVLLRVPVCYYFGITLGWGLSGVGLGAPAASLGSLIVIIFFLASGRWKQSTISAR
jgi:putative MATE family efflux protein